MMFSSLIKYYSHAYQKRKLTRRTKVAYQFYVIKFLSSYPNDNANEKRNEYEFLESMQMEFCLN